MKNIPRKLHSNDMLGVLQEMRVEVKEAQMYKEELTRTLILAKDVVEEKQRGTKQQN